MAGVRQTSSGVVQTSSGVAQTALGGTVIDGFNDGDIAEYAGDTAQFNVVTSPTVNSTSHALEGTPGNYAIYSGSLNYQPQAGDIWEYWTRPTAGTGAGNSNNTAFVFFAWDEANTSGYRIWHAFESGKIEIRRFDSGSGTFLADDTAVSYSANTWYRVLTEWGSGGSFTLTLDTGEGTSALTTLTFSDSNYTSGEIKWDTLIDSGLNAYFDEAIKTGTV